ncbi:drug resistance transporter, Bcr/CflA [Legionella beliardensis]|uniref:Drug resistance transporter, Bcr/CflA n=1 Tax=Legionella beliardensis TaxID=91822 RepID=A0A378I5S2_9GAMM|nr:MFS transporter [Legionella beliardensis]STX30100.1 drug resistance transporter, Bcr/CflA [Legionella beliardensis]
MNKRSYVIILLAWTLGNFSINLITPALPKLAADFHVSARIAQLTISIFLLGKALSIIPWGNISEYIGRKPVFILGLLIYSLANLFTALSSTIYLFLMGRFLQGIGVGATVLIGRAMINDSQNEQQATKQFAFFFSLSGLFICFLPLLGSFINTYYNWTVAFFAMAGYSFLLFLCCHGITETKPKAHYQSNLLDSMLLVFKNRLFVSYLLISSLMMAGESAFNTSAPFILIKNAHYSITAFGHIKTLMSILYVVGTLICGVMVKYWRSDFLVSIGIRFFITTACLMWILYYFNATVELAFIFPMMVYYFGTGFIVASATAASVRPFPKQMAIALAFSLFCQFNISALFSLLSSLLAIEHIKPFMILLSSISFLTLLVWHYRPIQLQTATST